MTRTLFDLNVTAAMKCLHELEDWRAVGELRVVPRASSHRRIVDRAIGIERSDPEPDRAGLAAKKQVTADKE